MPVIDDNSLVAQYIRAIENPDSVGFTNGRWEAPTNSKYDSNNRGFGVDVMHNNEAHTLTNNRQGRWLSEAEERRIRNEYIEENAKILKRHFPPMLLRQYPSEVKQAMALGMLYRGDGIGSILHTPSIKEAYLSGTDEDMQKAVANYYEKKIPSRAQNHNRFFNLKSGKSSTNTVPAMLRRRQEWQPVNFSDLQYKPKSKFSNGGFLNTDNQWDSLSIKDRAEMMKVALANGITTLSEIKEAYNKFAEGGPLKGWTLEDEANYRNWKSRLPKNLRDTKDADYDMRAAYKAGMQPEWNDKDKSYHLGSRDPKTGRILKSPHHPTYLQALTTDAALGYYPTIDSEGNTYTETWKGNEDIQRMLNNEYAEGGNLFGRGGYKPSKKLQEDIATWEGTEMKRNAPFSEMTQQFNAVIPREVQARLSTDQLDALYSYGYNVGMGNLKKRVLPTLNAYVNNQASREDVQKSMWASRDNELRGLTRRRNWERAKFGGGYRTTFTGKGDSPNNSGRINLGFQTAPASYEISDNFFDDFTKQISTVPSPSIQYADSMQIDPSTVYTPPVIVDTQQNTPEIKEEEPVYNPKQDRLDGLRRMEAVMGMLGQSNPFSGLLGNTISDNSPLGIMAMINGIYGK